MSRHGSLLPAVTGEASTTHCRVSGGGAVIEQNEILSGNITDPEYSKGEEEGLGEEGGGGGV